MFSMEAQSLYQNSLVEIKSRQEMIRAIASPTTLRDDVSAERIAQHLRKILELISYSLVALHQDAMPKGLRKKARKTWDPKKTLSLLKSFHPQYFPKPIIESRDQHNPQLVHCAERPSPWLTPFELVQYHAYLHPFNHARHPLACPPDLAKFESYAYQIDAKIVALLNSHQVVSASGKYMLIGHMNASEGGRDMNGRVQCYVFGRLAVHPAHPVAA